MGQEQSSETGIAGAIAGQAGAALGAAQPDAQTTTKPTEPTPIQPTNPATTNRRVTGKFMPAPPSPFPAEDRALWKAVRKGDAKRVQRLIASKASVNQPDSKGHTALHIAAALRTASSLPIMEQLIAASANVNAQDADGATPLFIAVVANKYPASELLLRRGAKPNTPNNNGWTPLLQAVTVNNRAIAMRLLYHGADAKQVGGEVAPMDVAQSAEMKTLLQEGVSAWKDTDTNLLPRVFVKAAFSGEARVKELTGRGIDINVIDGDRYSAIHQVVRLSFTNTTPKQALQAMEVLIKCGADVNLRAKEELTALHLAASARPEMISLLLSNGAEPNAVTDSVVTPLHITAGRGDLDALKSLIEFKASVDCQDCNGSTPLSYSVTQGHVTATSMLLDAGADSDLPNANGSTPLHRASRMNDLKIASLLIEKGALLDFINSKGQRPLEVAKSGEMRKLLKDAWSKQLKTEPFTKGRALFTAAVAGDADGVLSALKDGADVRVRDTEGWMAIHHAARKNHIKVVEILLAESPSRVRIWNMAGRAGWRPLHCAAWVGSAAICKLLAQAGAPASETNKLGNTALMCAARGSHVDAIEVLAELGASQGMLIDQRDSNGMTCLHHAVQHTAKNASDVSGVEVVLKHGADVDARDRQGRTALHVAAQLGRAAMVEVLLRARAAKDARDNAGNIPIDLATDHPQVRLLLLEQQVDFAIGFEDDEEELGVEDAVAGAMAYATAYRSAMVAGDGDDAQKKAEAASEKAKAEEEERRRKEAEAEEEARRAEIVSRQEEAMRQKAEAEKELLLQQKEEEEARIKAEEEAKKALEEAAAALAKAQAAEENERKAAEEEAERLQQEAEEKQRLMEEAIAAEAQRRQEEIELGRLAEEKKKEEEEREAERKHHEAQKKMREEEDRKRRAEEEEVEKQRQIEEARLCKLAQEMEEMRLLKEEEAAAQKLKAQQLAEEQMRVEAIDHEELKDEAEVNVDEEEGVHEAKATKKTRRLRFAEAEVEEAKPARVKGRRPKGRGKSASMLFPGMGMTVARSNLRAYEFLCVQTDIAAWLEECLRVHVPGIKTPFADSADTGFFADTLIDGVYWLCMLANKIEPGCVPRITDTSPKPNEPTLHQGRKIEGPLRFRVLENIGHLVEACRKIGVLEAELFEPADLLEKKNVPKVIDCLFSLSKLAAKKGFTPRLVQSEGTLEFSPDELKHAGLVLKAAGKAATSF